MGRYQTFIVRFWQGDGEESRARGHVQHVASGRGLYFRDFERMLRFFDEYLVAVAETQREALTGEEGAPGVTERVGDGTDERGNTRDPSGQLDATRSDDRPASTPGTSPGRAEPVS